MFFFNDTATTEIYTLSLHDALPICLIPEQQPEALYEQALDAAMKLMGADAASIQMLDEGGERLIRLASRGLRPERSEEHTSELQSRQYLVCRLLLEKKNNTNDLSSL